MFRFGALLAVVAAEVLVLTVSVDGAALQERTGLAGLIGVSGAWILRALIGFVAAFVAFASLRDGISISELVRQAQGRRLNWLAAGLHISTAALFALITAKLYSKVATDSYDLLAVAWVLAGVSALAAAALTFVPARFWKTLLHRTGPTWMYATAVALLATALTALSRSLWQWTARLTFRLVAFLLLPLYPNLIVQPELLRLRATHFGVIIDQACSGLEGAGLMLVFVLVWLAVSRRDLRFPRALLLVPAGVGILYVLNAVRIAVLLIIGDMGAREIAAGGFHSQAGWIAFNGVALGMTWVVPRLDWFRSETQLHPAETRSNWLVETPTALYLLPFLAILAAGMASLAASAQFEWLYALRLLAAVAVLGWLAKPLRQLDWRCGWLGPAAGVVVFALWVGLDRLAGTPATAMPAALAASAPLTRTVWITLRTLAAIVTVPIAEELAFRGFLMRRLNSPDFETVPLAKASLAGVALSSIAFGLLHGNRWVAGILAGLVYALVARKRGRIGESIVAHAVTNGMLAGWVLGLGAWQYW